MEPSELDTMQHIKGIVASGAATAGVVTAWLPQIETGLRICVSITGIVAGIYAARYWHKLHQMLCEGKSKTPPNLDK